MKSNSAYTLIELLIAMTIVTIVFTIGLASFRDFSRRQALSGILKSVIADLRSAQQFALTGQKPSGCITLSGYTFKMTGQYSYELFANCTPTDISIKQVNLTSNQIKIFTSPDLVKFKVLGQGTDLSAPLTITLTHDITSTTGQINVGIGGDIKQIYE